MKGKNLVAVVLIILGVASLVYQGISYTKRQELFRVGDFKATVERRKRIPVPPYLGVGLLAAGVIVLLIGNRRS
jgi:uncharacterized membrane protein YidH (DUF202 family)